MCSSKEFIQLTEQLLTFHAYYSQTDTFWEEGDVQGEKMLDDAMRVMLKQLTSTLIREGNGWNTAKTHSGFLHVARLVSVFVNPPTVMPR